jgi:TatD DNase family protein
VNKPSRTQEAEAQLWQAASDGPIIDTHLHLDSKSFSEDLDQVIARARQAGVKQMITIGCGAASSRRAIQIAEAHEDIFVAVGVHPHDAAQSSEEEIAILRDLASHPKVVAIGETGLDYHYMNSPKDIQQASFRRCLRLALETKLPFSIHTREAEEDTLQILEEEGGAQPMNGLIHCFSGTLPFAERCLAMGLYLSIPGIVSFAKDYQAVVKQLPLSRLVIETDAPFLAPHPFRGRRNEPAYTRQTARHLATLLNLPPHEVAAQTTRNAQTLFRLPAFV